MLRDFTILFVGDVEKADVLQTAAKPYSAYIYHASSMLEALGMYITCAPDAVVVDGNTPRASHIIGHLRSVDASPLVLMELVPNPEHVYGSYSIPHNTGAADVLKMVNMILRGKCVSTALSNTA